MGPIHHDHHGIHPLVGRRWLVQLRFMDIERAVSGHPSNGLRLFVVGRPTDRRAEKRIVAVVDVRAFRDEFCDIISLDLSLRDDARHPDATARAVVAAIRGKTAEEWRKRFKGRDCCCSIVATLEEAVADPQFRGLFTRALVNEAGARIPALPVPIAEHFRAPADEPQSAPALGAHNAELSR